MYDFSKINLLFSEHFKLFLMRFKKRVSLKFLGNQAEYLLYIAFIKANYSEYKNEIGERLPDGTYSLTDKYRRYIVYRHNELMKAIANSIVFPIIVSVAASVITSILTVLLLQQSVLK